MVRRFAWAAGGGRAAIVALAVLAVVLRSSSAVAATSPASSGSVRLELSPLTAHPGEKLRIVVVNDSSRTVYWGGCFGWQRLIDGRWQPATVDQCLAVAFFPPHSRRDETAPVPDSYGPGRYRISFLYQNSAATLSRSPMTAHAYLTVVPAAIGKGIVIGGIQNVGGDPLASRPFSAGVVTVFDLQGRVVAHERVRARQRFRFELPAGRYQLNVGGKLHPVLDCPPEMVLVKAGHTTRTKAKTGCFEY